LERFLAREGSCGSRSFEKDADASELRRGMSSDTFRIRIGRWSDRKIARDHPLRLLKGGYLWLRPIRGNNVGWI